MKLDSAAPRKQARSVHLRLRQLNECVRVQADWDDKEEPRVSYVRETPLPPSSVVRLIRAHQPVCEFDSVKVFVCPQASRATIVIVKEILSRKHTRGSA